MKISLLLLALICLNTLAAQNVSTVSKTSGTSIFSSPLADGGQISMSSSDLAGLIQAYHHASLNQGDVVYLTPDAAGARPLSNNLFGIVGASTVNTSTNTLESWGSIIPHISVLATGDALEAAQHSFFQSTDGQSAQLNNEDSSYLSTFRQGIGFFSLQQAYSLGVGPAFPLSDVLSQPTGPSQTTSPATAYPAFLNGYYSVASVQAGNSYQPIRLGTASIDQQLDVNSIIARDPTDRRAFFKVLESDSSGTYTTLTVFTGISPNRTNINGAINLRFPSGQTLGISGDSLMAYIGWQHNSNGDITLQARTIFTEANLIDNGAVSAQVLTLSDFPRTTTTTLPGILEYLTSNSSKGTGIFVENTSVDPEAAASIMLTQGTITNSIRTISSYSVSPTLPAGTFYIESTGPSGIILNSKNDGPTTFCANNEPVASVDAKKGLIVMVGYVGLPRVTTDDMMALTDMEPGYQVFNTDRQTIVTYTTEGWKYCKMHLFHYHKKNKT